MSKKNLILVVEDNDFVRAQIVSFLVAEGYDVLQAAEGNAAMDHVNASVSAGPAIDLAMVDVRMEPVGGFDFVKELRARAIDTPVVLVTGDETADLLERANIWGISAVLMKPVQKDRLIKMVARTIAAGKKLA